MPFFRAWGRRIRWGLRRCPANRFCRPTPRTRRSASDFHAPPPRPPPGPKTHVWGRSSVESRPDRRRSRGVRPPPPWGRCTRLVRPWAAVGASCGPTAVGCSVGVWTPCGMRRATAKFPRALEGHILGILTGGIWCGAHTYFFVSRYWPNLGGGRKSRRGRDPLLSGLVGPGGEEAVGPACTSGLGRWWGKNLGSGKHAPKSASRVRSIRLPSKEYPPSEHGFFAPGGNPPDSPLQAWLAGGGG